ncbi:MAG: hypothetical protein ACE37F_27485 [Nannocystaceae bacterium]|nr:hypothetical protein [bacterium]
MSDALDPPASRPATRWLLGMGLTAALGLGLYAAARDDEPDAPRSACPDAEPFGWQNDPAWLRTWTRDAAGSRGVLERDLATWAQRWATARDEACALPPEAREATLACLDRQAARARALADTLPELPEHAQRTAWAAALALPPTEDCGDARAVATPRDPDARATLDRAHALLAAGEIDAASELAASLDLGEDDPLRADARWLEGHGQPPAEAYATWQRALGDAIAADAPALASTIALALATSTPLEEGLTAAQRWWALASALARRKPTSATRQHALLATQASMLSRHGRPEAALSVHEPALALLESSVGGVHPALVPGLRESAVAAASVGNLDAAERLATRALELADEALGARHPEALATLDAIAGALQEGGAPEKATAWLRMANERRPEARRGPGLVQLGEAYLQAGRFGDAADTFERAATWSLTHEGAALTLRIALGRAAVAQARGDADTAAEHLERALAADLDARARDTVRLRLVAVLLDAERFDDARAAASLALEATKDADDAARGEALSMAADVALRSGRAKEAIVLARRAVARLVRARGTDDASVLLALTHLGTACLAESRNDEAAAAFARAFQIARSGPPEVEVAAALGWATALWRTGSEDEAAELIRDVHGRVTQAPRPGAAADAAAWLAQHGLSLEPPAAP